MRTRVSFLIALSILCAWPSAWAEECSSNAEEAPGRASCSITAGSGEDGIPIPESHALMKGVELYSWRESGAWFFSLVSGKNSGADKSEILGAKMRGSHGLKRKLRALPEGTSILINPHAIDGMKFSAPPKNILEDLKRVARERKLELE